MTTMKLAAALAASGLLASAWAQAPDEAARTARYLAANCANCHGTMGTSEGATPSLAGQQKGYIVDQVKAFRDGKRPSTIMHQLAKGYTDQQIELIADYFSRQKPAR